MWAEADDDCLRCDKSVKENFSKLYILHNLAEQLRL